MIDTSCEWCLHFIHSLIKYENGKIDYEKIYRFNCTTSSSRTATVDITSIINMLNQIGSSNSYRPIKVSFYGFTTGEVVSGEFMNVLMELLLKQH